LKIKVIDNNGEITVDAGSLKVGDINLGDLLKRFIKLENDFKRLQDAYTKREQTLKEAIKKL
jgi:hypothetical protein